MFHLENEHIELYVVRKGENGLLVSGEVKKASKYTERIVMAANPIDRMMNYSGSGLAFTNPEIAFDNSPNYFEVSENGNINTTFIYPNSYYTQDSMSRIIPSIFIILKKNGEAPIYYQLKLEDELPLKTSTTYRPEHDEKKSMFYSQKELVMGIPPSQEWILRNIGDYKVKHGIA